jgi:hypothetical protein
MHEDVLLCDKFNWLSDTTIENVIQGTNLRLEKIKERLVINKGFNTEPNTSSTLRAKGQL